MRWITALAATLLFPVAASAADSSRMFQTLPAASCGTPLPATGRAIALQDTLDETTRRGVLAGVFLAMHDPTGAGWTKADVDTAQACPVARFATKDHVWTIHSGAGTAPVRLILGVGSGSFYALVRGPALADAATWHANRQGLPSGGSGAYYLFGFSDGLAYLAKIYDAPPPMEQIADTVALAEDGDFDALAAYSQQGGAVSLLVRAPSGPQAEIFRPGDLNGEMMATLFLPDGQLVTQADDGGFAFKGSGYVCPGAYGDFERINLSVLNVSEEALELGCYLSSDAGALSVFVRRAPDPSGDKRYFADQIAVSEKETGVSRKLPLPPVGPNRAIHAGRNWIDKDGQVQVVLFKRLGGYIYEIRQTHPPEAFDKASEALIALAADLEQAPPQDAPVDAWRRAREKN